MRERPALEFTPETRPQWAWPPPDATRHVGHLVPVDAQRRRQAHALAAAIQQVAQQSPQEEEVRRHTT